MPKKAKAWQLSFAQQKVVNALREAGAYIEEVLPTHVVLGARVAYDVRGPSGSLHVQPATMEVLMHYKVVMLQARGPREDRRWIINPESEWAK